MDGNDLEAIVESLVEPTEAQARDIFRQLREHFPRELSATVDSALAAGYATSAYVVANPYTEGQPFDAYLPLTQEGRIYQQNFEILLGCVFQLAGSPQTHDEQQKLVGTVDAVTRVMDRYYVHACQQPGAVISTDPKQTIPAAGVSPVAPTGIALN